MEAGTTVQVTFPQMGESVSEGTVLEWRKQVGDAVQADEPLVEISTDKVDAEVPAPASGTLVKILAEPDQTVDVGSVLGEIEADGAEPEDPGPEPPPEAELVDVAFPQMGDSVSEGTVIEWRKQAGESVRAEEPLVEISTDKVDAEVPAPVAGTVAEVLVEPDETVPVGAVLCRIAPGEPAPSPQQPAAKPTETHRAGTPEPGGNGASAATPVAVRIASAHGLDLSSGRGSGPRGRVTKTDVLDALAGDGVAPPATGDGTSKPIRGPAATLVRFMNESRSI